MSETRIVNRFPITAGLDRDLQELDQAKSEAEVIVNQAVDSVATAKATRDGSVGQIDLPAPYTPEQGVTAGILAQSDAPEIDQNEMSQARALSVALTEIASLRASVIRAFKHMGIDTRKFFS